MKCITLLLLLLPLAGLTQVFTANIGPSFSTIVPPRRTGNPLGFDNIIVGLSASGSVDFAETKRKFFSANVGIVQKGRRDKTTYTDGNNSYTKINKTRFSYGTASFTANFKLSSGSLVPFLSVGPRVDYFIDQPEGSLLPTFLFGANGGIGLMQYAGNWRYGVRADYLYNFTRKPDDRTAVLMAFVGFKFPKKNNPLPKAQVVMRVSCAILPGLNTWTCCIAIQ